MIQKYLQALKKRYLQHKVRSFVPNETEKGKERYFTIQQQQTIAKIDKDARFRYERIIGHALPFIAENERSQKKVVCVGCRNVYELREFQKHGFRDVKGIDLVSVHPDILIMDMHDLKFPDQSIDVIYSADSLEHTYDPTLAARNFLRVLRPNGFICLSVPIEWRKALGREHVHLPDSPDCQDFQSREQVLGFFASGSPKVLYEEMYEGPDGSNNWLAILQVNQQQDYGE